MSFYELNADERDYFYFNRVKKEQRTLPHFHSAIEMLFCVEGRQELCIGGELHTLQKGDACFIDSYIVHSLPPSKAELYVVLGDVHFFQSVFFAFENKRPPSAFCFKDQELLDSLYALHKRAKKLETGRIEASKAIVKLLIAEIAENVSFHLKNENKKNELVATILQYAAEHFAEDLSLGKLSALFGYSHDYLSRVLHRYLGVNWNRYIGDLRAKEAHAILHSETELSVLDAALHCGFESLNTFYRAYRRVYGKTPLKKDNI